MPKIQSIKETLGKSFIISLLTPFYLIVIITLVLSALYLKDELDKDQERLLEYGENALFYEIDLASRILIESLNNVEDGFIDDAQVSRYFDNQLNDNAIIHDLMLLDETGKVIQTNSDDRHLIGFDYSLVESFINARSDRVYWSSALLSTHEGEISFNISYKAHSGNVIIAKFVPKEFQTLVVELSKENLREVALTSDDGIFLAHSDYENVQKRSRELNMTNLLESDNESITMYYNDELMVITLRKIGTNDLYLIIYTRFNEYYRDMAMLAITTLAIVALLTFLVIRYLGKHTSQINDSLDDMIELTGEVSTGNYGYQLDYTTYDEFNKLVEHFNDMSMVIKENFVDLSNTSAQLETLNEDLLLQNEKIRENEAQIEKILSSTYDGIMLIDNNSNVLRYNKAILELFDIDRSKLKKKMKCHELLAEEHANCEVCTKSLVEKTGINQQKLMELHGKLMEESTSPLYEDDKVIGFIKTYKDITSRKELEKKVNRATKMEAIGRLTSGIAHDFNNILQVIVGYSELIYYQLENLNASGDILQKVKSINDASLKAERLIRKLMTFSKMDQVAKELIDINDSVSDISLMLGRIIGENITLELELDEDLPKIHADKTQLEQIVVNLCVNAKDAIEGHGRIKIKTYETLRKSGCFICLEISDTGKGMSDEVKDKVFEPFFTTKGIGQGTGLGLATVLGIVEGHGGVIELESEPGLGTTFKIIFPNEHVRSITLDQNVSKIKNLDFSGLKVLFIEDDDMLLNIHKNMLETVGMNVSVAANGIEATEKYSHAHHEIDVVVLDSVIPEMSARNVLEQMKKIDQNIRVLMTTSINDDFIMNANEQYNDIRFLPKPYKSQELIKAIEMVVYG